MHEITVNLADRPYRILIGPQLLAQVGAEIAALAPTSIHIVTDARVAPLYAPIVRRACAPVAPTHELVLAGGETEKQMASVTTVIDALVAQRADRRSIVVALGGGVIGDLAGFAAAIYMRGLRVVQVPTTLLAQVDSSVGGKTGVNHAHGKNLIGAFHQPSLVISDTATLQSLPLRERAAGLAEVLKHGLIADADYFDRVVRALPQLLAGEADELADVVARSCEIKAAIVARDEREHGDRALLNLGHTFAHAIELLTGYGRWLHGEAVGCGMCLAADLSRRLGRIDAADHERVVDAVRRATLPVRIDGLSMAASIDAMRADKKAQAGRIRFIVLERIGRAVQGEADDATLSATLAAAGFRS